jgi:hypothetical protein
MLIDTTNPLMNTLAAIEAQGFDPASFVAAARAKPHAPRADRPRRELHPATSSAPCPRCGVSGWNGCEHQGPYQGQPVPRGNVRPVGREIR